MSLNQLSAATRAKIPALKRLLHKHFVTGDRLMTAVEADEITRQAFATMSADWRQQTAAKWRREAASAELPPAHRASAARNLRILESL